MVFTGGLAVKPTTVLMFVALLAGCATSGSEKRYEAYRQMLTPMVATATREDCVRKFGIPTRREQLGTLEVWQYEKSNAERKTLGTDARRGEGPGGEAAFADDVTLIFDPEGRLQSWRAEGRK
jgi:hypothetical protein